MKQAAFLGALLILAYPLAVPASTLYAVSDSTDELYEIDVANQLAWLVGPTGVDVSYSGLAFDTATGTLWVSDVLTETPGYGLGRMSRLSGAVQVVGDHGGYIPINVMGLAFDSINNALLGADVDNAVLVRISRWGDELLLGEPAGSATEIGPWVNTNDIRGLAYNSLTNVLYGADSTHLYTIDVATGLATPRPQPHGLPIGPAYIGLEYDRHADVLYAVGGADDMLYSVNMTTGVGTPLFATGVTSLSGLAVIPGEGDSGYGVMYATDVSSDTIWTMSRRTGASSLVGPALVDLDSTGLAFYTPTQKLLAYGVLSASPGYQLGQVDTLTGEVTPIGEPNVNQFPISGLAYDPSWNMLWGADNQRSDLVQVNPVTGETLHLDMCLTPSYQYPGTECLQRPVLNIIGLAYNPTMDRLYGISGDALYVIHRSAGGPVMPPPWDSGETYLAGEAELIDYHFGSLGDTQIGLEWSPLDGTLYAVGAEDDNLYIIDQLTGQAEAVGSTGLAEPSGLAIMPEGLIFADGFETGDTSRWSATTP